MQVIAPVYTKSKVLTVGRNKKDNSLRDAMTDAINEMMDDGWSLGFINIIENQNSYAGAAYLTFLK